MSISSIGGISTPGGFEPVQTKNLQALEQKVNTLPERGTLGKSEEAEKNAAPLKLTELGSTTPEVKAQLLPQFSPGISAGVAFLAVNEALADQHKSSDEAKSDATKPLSFAEQLQLQKTKLKEVKIKVGEDEQGKDILKSQKDLTAEDISKLKEEGQTSIARAAEFKIEAEVLREKFGDEGDKRPTITAAAPKIEERSEEKDKSDVGVSRSELKNTDQKSEAEEEKTKVADKEKGTGGILTMEAATKQEFDQEKIERERNIKVKDSDAELWNDDELQAQKNKTEVKDNETKFE